MCPPIYPLVFEPGFLLQQLIAVGSGSNSHADEYRSCFDSLKLEAIAPGPLKAKAMGLLSWFSRTCYIHMARIPLVNEKRKV